MELLRKGSRLSIQPVTEAEWKTIMALAGGKPKKEVGSEAVEQSGSGQ